MKIKLNTGEVKEFEIIDRESFEEELQEFMKAKGADDWRLYDWEGIPAELVKNGKLRHDFWDYIELIDSGFDESAAEAGINAGLIASEIEDSYYGYYEKPEDFAYEMADSMYNLEQSWPFDCIDWSKAADALMYDFLEHDGHYFRS